MAKYRLYRNKIITLTRLSKKLYYHNFFETNMSNIKNIWKGINLLINGKTRGYNVITALKRPGNGGLSHNADEIPNIMNSFFSSIDPNLAARIPQAQKHFSSFLPKQNNAGSFLFKPVTPIEIEAEILSIPLNKVYGLYSCPTRILKSASKIISSPLCKLIRLHSLCMLQGGAEDFFFSGSFFYIPPQGPYKFSEPPKQSAEKLIPPPPPSPLPRNIKINICIIVNYICLKSQETCLIRTSREL